jgi:hypothetical protein
MLFTDPLAVTYDGSAKSLPRVGAGRTGATYRTADRELEITISGSRNLGNGVQSRSINLGRLVPDPTPGDVFDDYRLIRPTFGLVYYFDAKTRAGVSDIPNLRTALLALVDTTFQGRLIAGEQ